MARGAVQDGQAVAGDEGLPRGVLRMLGAEVAGRTGRALQEGRSDDGPAMNRRFLLTKGPAMQIRIVARSFTILLLFGVMAAAAGAHHSAAQFDFGNTVLVTGKVVSARLAKDRKSVV